MEKQLQHNGLDNGPQRSFFDRILDYGKNIGMVMIFIAFAGICWHVIMRYLFHMPINWFIDISTLFMFYLTFLGSAWLLREKGHVSLDVLSHHLGNRKYKKVEAVTNFICAMACLVVVYYGIIETYRAVQLELIVDMPLEPPKWIVLWLIPVGFFIMAIEFLRQVFGGKKAGISR